MPSTKQLQLIHRVVRELKLTDENYRAILQRVARVSTSRDLDDRGLDAVLVEFEKLGWQRPRRKLGLRLGRATDAQMHKVRSLWADFTKGKGTEQGLRSWLTTYRKVAAPEFMTHEDARKAITALTVMCQRRQDAA